MATTDHTDAPPAPPRPPPAYLEEMATSFGLSPTGQLLPPSPPQEGSSDEVLARMRSLEAKLELVMGWVTRTGLRVEELEGKLLARDAADKETASAVAAKRRRDDGEQVVAEAVCVE